ncbi:small subunit ribosomal protein S6e [Nematocida sp. ERTm5]|nr:small subunit ribosomal protein S6e [Nematocida sp. AWRm79]KAI5182402.1 small subunit ribosomal protein S6e [Nematocida sp. AWRm78]OAG30580.1 small subunit ribosomal protein S6e [Nematocida sp. ERTm5]
MKLSIANPERTTQKVIEIEHNVESALYEKRIMDVIEGELIAPEWSGFLLQLTGGTDKQGFPMKPGVMTPDRVRLLLKKGDTGFRCTDNGLRRRKSVRGDVVSEHIGVLNLKVVKEGSHVFEGFNDIVNPLARGPKRASKIRKLFGLSSDVMNLEDYVIPHTKTTKSGETKVVKPKIQRLITEKHIQRWQERIAARIERQKLGRERKAKYFAMMKERGLLTSRSEGFKTKRASA